MTTAASRWTRLRRVLLCTGLCLTSCSISVGALASAAFAASGDWTQFRYGADHTGYNPNETAIGVSNLTGLTTEWTGATSGSIASSPAVANGVVYVGSADDKLYAFDATGNPSCSYVFLGVCTPLWTAMTGGPIYSSPAVANGIVYVGSNDHELYAFDAAGNTNCSGAPKVCQPLWTATTGNQVHSPPTVANGVVYVGSSDQKLYAFDATGTTHCSGAPKVCQPLWTAPTNGGVYSSPAVANGLVYVGSYNSEFDGRLYAFDATGTTNCSGTPKVCQPLWIANTGDAISSSPGVANGVVYVGSLDGKFYAFDAAGETNCSGTPKVCEPLWITASDGHPIESSPAVANGVVYVGSDDGQLYAYDASGSTNCSGSPKVCAPLWTTATTSDLIASSPAVANGVVYVTLYSGGLYAFDAAGSSDCSGAPKVCTPLWTETVGSRNTSSPAIANGVVYVASGEKDSLYAFAFPTTPGSPNNVSATPKDSSAEVTWNPPEDGGGGKISGYTVTASPGGANASSNGAYYATVTGLANGTSYTFTVTATNSVGTGPPSAPSSPVTPEPAPNPPTSVTAAGGNTDATVNWTALLQNAGGAITGYTVTATPGGQSASVDGSTTQATVTGLANGTSYSFTVTATNAYGTSAPSGASNSVIPEPTVPDPPTNVVATPKDSSAVVSWAPPANNGGSTISSYSVTTTDTTNFGNGGKTNSSSSSPLTITGLTNGDSYTFTVTGTNSIGESQSSAPSSPVTPQPSPNPPTAASATAGYTEATVSWTAPAPNAGGMITSYSVTAEDATNAGNGGETVTSATSPATLTALTDGDSYTFTVTATNAYGASSPSAASNAVIPAPTFPDPPTDVAGAPGDQRATVSWSPPANDGGSPIMSYTATAEDETNAGGGAEMTGISSSPVIFTGLANGDSYIFTVTATNANGTSSASAPSSAVTPRTIPQAPANVSATGGDGDATVTWSPPTDDGGSPVIAYTATSSPGGETATVDGSSTEATVSGLSNGISYAFTVTAANAAGPGPSSAASNAVVPASVPDAPLSITATAGASSTEVSWAPAFDGGHPITSYTVTSSPGDVTARAAGNATSADVIGLSDNTTYTFTVTATNDVGIGVPSVASNAVRPPGLPWTFTVNTTSDDGNGTCDATKCTLRDAIADANSYGHAAVIDFHIADCPSGVCTITPSLELPIIADQVTIDGTTQPGYVGDPLIVLQPAGFGALADGLVVQSSGITVKGLDVNSFSHSGIWLDAPGGDVVAGNYLGTDASGTVDFSANDGVLVTSPGNTIGGRTTVTRNVISGNTTAGVDFSGAAATGNVLEGNYIGVDASGGEALGNAQGVLIENGAGSETIGASAAGAGNVISASTTNGVDISAGTGGNVIAGNFIGTDANGKVGLGNSEDGVLVDNSESNVVGGTDAGAGNLISGNTGEPCTLQLLCSAGVEIEHGLAAPGNLVEGNLIGTDVTGTLAVPNYYGVWLSGTRYNTVGGTAAGAANVISGNSSDGVHIEGISPTSARFNDVEGNSIGQSGTANVRAARALQPLLDTAPKPVANKGNGVFLGAPNDTNQIGGKTLAARNTIVNNKKAGVCVLAGQFDPVLHNTLEANARLGIDLGCTGQVIENHPGGSGTGPNLDENYPVLASASLSGSGSLTKLIVGGDFNSKPSASYAIQVFASSACDPSGHGQGQTFLGQFPVSTDSKGNNVFRVTLAAPGLNSGQVVTATATDAHGDTSEFSLCAVAGAPQVSVTDSGFSPTTTALPLGAWLEWHFYGPHTHTASDATGMGLFNSGTKPADSLYSFRFTSAGSYAYTSTVGTKFNGAVDVPMTARPLAGVTSTSFDLTWASATPPSGFLFDVQILRPGKKAFAPWLTGTKSLSASFKPDGGVGTYVFEARLRRVATGKVSGWSPTTRLSVQ